MKKFIIFVLFLLFGSFLYSYTGFIDFPEPKATFLFFYHFILGIISWEYLLKKQLEELFNIKL